MAIHYVCRYCHDHIGQLDAHVLDWQDLGFSALTQEEKERIVHELPDGNMLVQVVCEHCQDAINRHPELVLQARIHQ